MFSAAINTIVKVSGEKEMGLTPKKIWSSQISWKIFYGLYDDYNKDTDIEAKWILQKLESAFNWTKMKVN